MPTNRPFVPIGSFDTKSKANTAAQEMSKDTGQRWIPCKGSKTKFAIVRKD